MTMTYDFIVVGSGPSGSTVAARLASTPKKPTVLLVEAGESRLDKESLVGFDRWPLALEASPMNWPIVSTPQERLGGRQIDLHTGKALGGSSAINMAMWTVGHAADYNEWARRVGDDAFNWDNVSRHLKRLENYGRNDVVDLGKYSSQEQSSHGTGGQVRIDFAGQVVRQAVPIMDAFVESGLPANPDLNSGSSLGVGVIPLTVTDGWRTSAATAFLTEPPHNLTIKTNALVTRILFEGTKATGIAVGDETFHATNEVIISAGALRTPQLLMVSGIGPEAHLESLGITCIKDLPVGQTLQDHTVVPLLWEVDPGFSDQIAWLFDPEHMRKVREEFVQNGTGPLKDFYSPMPVVYLRPEELVESSEMAELPDHIKTYFGNAEYPLAELCPVLPGVGSDPSKTFLRISTFPMAITSVGTVTLSSADIKDAPVVDPNYFSTPFDRKTAVSLVRAVKSIIENSDLSKSIVAQEWGPASDADDDIFAFVKELCISAWHYSCSVKMGPGEDGKACLDSDFRVLGTSSLRVADLSAAALLPMCHTQAVGYIIGEIMAEKLVQQYDL